MSIETPHAKQLGAMMGEAIGDAVGTLAARGLDRDALLREIERETPLRYTDNTALMLAVAETLSEFGGIDPQILGRRFQDYCHRERWRGYGEGMRTIQALVTSEGVGYVDAAARLHGGAGSWGNGACTRVIPLAIHYSSREALDEAVLLATRVSHAHPLAIDASHVLTTALRAALTANALRPFAPQHFAAKLTASARSAGLREKLSLLASLLDESADAPAAAQCLGLGAAAQDTVPFALFCFLAHPHEFMECVLAATLNGGDRDTMGALAGALSGAFLGMDAIPVSWRERLENAQHIVMVTHELVARH